MIFVETRQDGIAVATIKSGDGPHNTLDKAFNERLLAVVKELAADEDVKGVVLASAKDTFCGGRRSRPVAVRARTGRSCRNHRPVHRCDARARNDGQAGRSRAQRFSSRRRL